jgi:NAD(P)-dependent dehydrogenase (short-subunit alcohol dehydrogenase family)
MDAGPEIRRRDGSSAGFGLAGHVALVTGGGTGIGFGIANAFVQAGCRVVIAGRREDVLRQAVLRLGENASYTAHDVSDLAAAPALIENVRRLAGTPAILVNNAGMHLKKPSEATTDAEFADVYLSNVSAGVALARAALPGMIEAGSGRILFVASMASLVGIPDVLAYSAAKSALLGVVRSLAVDWGRDGIRVNAIAPGFIESDMMRQAMARDAPRRERVLTRTPMGRFGHPNEVAEAALFLCSDAASFVTGVCLPVDGGFAGGF